MTPTGFNRHLLPITDGKREQISSALPRGAFVPFRPLLSCRAYVPSFISYSSGDLGDTVVSPLFSTQHVSDPMVDEFGYWSQAKEVGRLVEDQIVGDLPTFVRSSPTATPTAQDVPPKDDSKDETLTKDESPTTDEPLTKDETLTKGEPS